MAAPLLRAAVLVVSTTAAADPSTDAADAALRDVFAASGDGKWTVVDTQIVPDDEAAIRSQIVRWTDGADGADGAEQPAVNLVVTTGGTGFAVSDVTPEAVGSLIEKPAPGLVHGMLAASLQVTPFAVMSRPVAGVRGRTLLVTLPGSPKGARENLLAVLKMLPHACVLAAGWDSRALHTGGLRKLEREAGVAGTADSLPSSDNGQGHSHDHSHDHSHGHGHDHSHGHGHGLVRHDQPAALLSNDPALGPARRLRVSPYPMITVDEALARIEQHTPGPAEAVRPVDEDLVGFVLAEDVYAAEDVPAFSASIVDGYAVAVTDDGSAHDVSGVFPVVAVAHAQAGDATASVLQPGEAARITTGAPLPPGANAVVMVESTEVHSRRAVSSREADADADAEEAEEAAVTIQATGVRAGDNVRAVGSDMPRGALLLRRGERITAVGGEMGLLASVGVRRVRVYRRPVVGVLSTGNELVEARGRGAGADADAALRLGQVRDTNRPTLLVAARAWGFDTVDLGIAPDEPGALEQRLRDSLRAADVVVTSGGVSMGELDLLKPTVERALGGTIHFGRVAMKPGKPTTFATVAVKEARAGGDDHHARRVVRPVFALPGNPASALVTFHLFVLPALRKMAGELPHGLPRVPVVLGHAVALDPARPEYHRAVVRVRAADGLLVAASTGGQRSSKVSSMRSANALLCLPAGAGPLPAGARVDALLMGNVRSE